MSRDADFARFARDHTTGTMLALRRMAGATFTESDRESMEDGLGVIRVALVQPVGQSCAVRVPGAVSELEYDRAVMQVVCSAMQLWSSGRLDEVEVDDGRG